jgi:hypothetical protein
VIGNRDDVELAGLPVQIDDFAQPEPFITPRCMDVEIAQQEGFVSSPWNSIAVLNPPIRSSESRRTAKFPP